MSILLVYDCIYPNSIGGVEHRNLEIAQRLAERGHKVARAGWAGRSTVTPSNLGLVPMAFESRIHADSGKRSVMAAMRFALACCRVPLHDFDVIETANIPHIHIVPLALRCWWAGKPLVVTWHEYWGGYWLVYMGRTRGRLFAGIEWLCAQLGRAVSAVSPLTAGRLAMHRIARGPVAIVPCGISLERIAEATANTVRDGTPLVYAGRLVSDKRLELLIRAVPQVRSLARHPGPVLKIIGEGPERVPLERLVADLELRERVQFVGRLDPSREVWREVARARVAVQPSAREGFGMFALEALACGTPVVYCESAENALMGLIQDGEQGLCAQATAASVAASIEALLRDPAGWERMSVRARTLAARFRWDQVVDEAESFFRQALLRKR